MRIKIGERLQGTVLYNIFHPEILAILLVSFVIIIFVIKL